VSVGCKYRPISVKRNLKIEANVTVSECTVLQRVAYKILRNYFLLFIFRGVLTPKQPAGHGMFNVIIKLFQFYIFFELLLTATSIHSFTVTSKSYYTTMALTLTQLFPD